jgi:hypothetical protein
MHRHPDLQGSASAVRAILRSKCAHVAIDVPTLTTIESSPYRQEIEQEWVNMLGHQLPQPLPPFDNFWNTLPDVFAWLNGNALARLPKIASFERDDIDPSWTAPRAMSNWRVGFPLEMVRYAGANRLKVEVDYRAAQGRQGPRIVEPYSLRRTKRGRLMLYVINDRGQLRSYGVDRIAGIRATSESFRPRRLVEF